MAQYKEDTLQVTSCRAVLGVGIKGVFTSHFMPLIMIRIYFYWVMHDFYNLKRTKLLKAL